MLCLGDRMAHPTKTVILPLLAPSGVKNTALAATEELFGRIVPFHVRPLLAEESLWSERSPPTRLRARPGPGQSRPRSHVGEGGRFYGGGERT